MKIFNRTMLAVILAGLTLSSFAQIDTTGIGTWKPMYNSSASWEEGAFGAHAIVHPDYGWGVYNMITHGLLGDSLFVIKLQDGSYKRLWIVEKDGLQNYTFRYADLDGENPKEVSIGTNDYSSKLFVQYSLTGNSVVDQQPSSADWDLLLTKFQHTGLNYVVTGFLANDSVTVSVFNAADSTAAAASTLADTTEFTDSIAAIGNSWYQLQGMSIVPLDTISYFVKTAPGEIYKLQVTFFESGYSGLGRVGIRKQLLSGTPDPDFLYDTLVMGMFYANEIYYNVGSKAAHSVPRSIWDIGFKTGIYTSSIIANNTMGVELYTYPHADISAWNPPAAVIRSQASEMSIRVYPLPAVNDLFIEHSFTANDHVSIRLYDMYGRLVQERVHKLDGESHIRYDVSRVKPGMYILQLKNRNAQAESIISIK